VVGVFVKGTYSLIRIRDSVRRSGRVTDVVEGHEYEFRVIAVNKVGPSQPSDISKSVVAKPRFSKRSVATFTRNDIVINVCTVVCALLYSGSENRPHEFDEEGNSQREVLEIRSGRSRRARPDHNVDLQRANNIVQRQVTIIIMTHERALVVSVFGGRRRYSRGERTARCG